jgi:hypothetical protein
MTSRLLLTLQTVRPKMPARARTAAAMFGAITSLVASAAVFASPPPAAAAITPTRARTVLRFAAVGGRHGANHFLLRRAGARLQLLDEDTGALLRNVAFARTSGVSIDGADGHIDNTLTLDFSGGSLGVPGGISYAGGRGGYNVLALHGGRFANEREIARTPHAGLIVLGDTTVHYAQIAPISDTTPAVNYTLNATAASETINVVNGPIVGGAQTTQVNSSGKTFELVNFANKANVTVNGNGGNDTFEINNTIPAVGETAMAVASGERESSTFNVVASSVPLSVVGGGTDTANIGVGSAASLTSPIAISDPASFINVNIDDSANTSSSRFVTLSSNGTTDTVSGLTQSTVKAQANDLASLTLSGGSAGNTFIVDHVSGGTPIPITLNTGMGTDSTFVQTLGAGSTLAIHGQNGADGVAVSNAGTVQGILGPVSIDNTLGFTNLTLDDSNDAGARAASLANDGTTDTIAGLAPASITVRDSDLGAFTLDGGSGGNLVTLAGLSATGTTTLNTGTGADTINVEPTSSVGPLDINGQAGKDTVDLGSAGSVQSLTGGVTVTNGAATKLTINDSSDTTARTVVVGTTAVSGLAPAAISFAGVPSLTVDGGSPSDTFAVTPSATTTDEVVGGGPASIPTPGNTLNMELAGANAPALSGTPSAAGAQGTWSFANRSPVSFSHMQSLNPTAMSVGDAATAVGGSGSAPLSFPVTLLASSTQPVSAAYATADGSATAASGAYQPASGKVLFPAGATSETVLVNALGAPTVRPPQTVLLGLVEPVNALLGRSLATGTITDSFTPPTPLPQPAPSPGPTVAPVITHLTQTHTSWSAGRSLAVIARSAHRRPPLGTSFSFDLNEPAGVTLAFSQSTNGRRSRGRCVAQTKKTGKGRACKLVVTKTTPAMSAHAGVDRISFQGRISPTATLKPGRYTLVVTATNAAGQRARSSALTFTIVK